jgi:hypothetical protein
VQSVVVGRSESPFGRTTLARTCTELARVRSWPAIECIELAIACTDLASRSIASTMRPEASPREEAPRRARDSDATA